MCLKQLKCHVKETHCKRNRQHDNVLHPRQTTYCDLQLHIIICLTFQESCYFALTPWICSTKISRKYMYPTSILIYNTIVIHSQEYIGQKSSHTFPGPSTIVHLATWRQLDYLVNANITPKIGNFPQWMLGIIGKSVILHTSTEQDYIIKYFLCHAKSVILTSREIKHFQLWPNICKKLLIVNG